jgi:hypothetical protein
VASARSDQPVGASLHAERSRACRRDSAAPSPDAPVNDGQRIAVRDAESVAGGDDPGPATPHAAGRPGRGAARTSRRRARQPVRARPAPRTGARRAAGSRAGGGNAATPQPPRSAASTFQSPPPTIRRVGAVTSPSRRSPGRASRRARPPPGCLHRDRRRRRGRRPPRWRRRSTRAELVQLGVGGPQRVALMSRSVSNAMLAPTSPGRWMNSPSVREHPGITSGTR